MNSVLCLLLLVARWSALAVLWAQSVGKRGGATCWPRFRETPPLIGDNFDAPPKASMANGRPLISGRPDPIDEKPPNGGHSFHSIIFPLPEGRMLSLLLPLVGLLAVGAAPPPQPIPLSAVEFLRPAPEDVAAELAAAAATDVGDPGFYTYELARNKMLYFASAAYSPKPEICLHRHIPNATVERFVETTCEVPKLNAQGFAEKETCTAFTALSHNDRAIVISFRGTNSLLQLIKEVNYAIFHKKKPAPLGGEIGSYFHQVFRSLWLSGVGQDVERLMEKHPNYELWVTGHSLGGAIASITATHLLNEYELSHEKIKLITYGQPRTGDREFANKHNLKLPKTYRVVNKRDIVPHVPPAFFQNYHHYGSEIWYPKGMDPGQPMVVCNEGESKRCSDGQFWDISIKDHIFYFGIHISKFAESGCDPASISSFAESAFDSADDDDLDFDKYTL